MKPKRYKENDQPGDMVCEPLAAYGPEVILDPAQRYTYADYLTWADNKRRELIDDIVYTPDAKVPVRTIEGLKIGLKELFEE